MWSFRRISILWYPFDRTPTEPFDFVSLFVPLILFGILLTLQLERCITDTLKLLLFTLHCFTVHLLLLPAVRHRANPRVLTLSVDRLGKSLLLMFINCHLVVFHSFSLYIALDILICWVTIALMAHIITYAPGYILLCPVAFFSISSFFVFESSHHHKCTSNPL